MTVRVIVRGAAATGRTSFAGRRRYVYACDDVSATQRALMEELLARVRVRVAPAAVKPALRGRRHGW